MRKARNKIVKEILTTLNLPESQSSRLPEIVRRLAILAQAPPCVIAFAFQPVTGRVLSVANSPMPQTSEAFLQAATAASMVSQKLMEAANDANMGSKQEGVERVPRPHNHTQSRDGVGHVGGKAGSLDDSGEPSSGGNSGDSGIT